LTETAPASVVYVEGEIVESPMRPFKGIAFKLISALLFAAMSALGKLGDVAPVGSDGVFS
jgi:hypothetical protein